MTTEYRYRQQPNEPGPEWRARLLRLYEDARAAVEAQAVTTREAEAVLRDAQATAAGARRSLQSRQKAYNAAADALDEAMQRVDLPASGGDQKV